MNKKHIFFSVTVVGLILVIGVAVLARKDFDDCQEPAFQGSRFFGQMPRRYFTITHLPQMSSPFDLRYLLSFYCSPYAVLSASRFTCKLQSEAEPSKEESKMYTGLIDGCESANQ